MSIRDRFFLRFYGNDEDRIISFTYLLLSILTLIAHIVYHIFFTKYNMVYLIKYNLITLLFYALLIIFRSRIPLNIYIILWNLEITVFTTYAILKMGFGFGFEFLFLILMSTNIFLFNTRPIIKLSFTFLQGGLFLFLYIKDYSLWSFDNNAKIFYILNFFSYFVVISIVNYMSVIFWDIKNKMDKIILTQEKEKYKQIAEYDILTGLVRKFYMEEELDSSITKYNNKVIDNVVVIFADIDDFKMINDTYGHQNGDIVLSKIGKIFCNSFREYDIACRWGGEEFLILMKNVKRGYAHIIIDKIREKISNEKFKFNKDTISVTMTFGVCAAYDNEVTSKEIIKIADELLYTGKKLGKNRVIYKEI